VRASTVKTLRRVRQAVINPRVDLWVDSWRCAVAPSLDGRSNGLRSNVSCRGAGVRARAPDQNREGLFTSDLSVSEFLLISHAGFGPG